ncbi:MAG: hypothetical protein IRY94_07540 [Rhodospirillaceae bacterium]|nr:hypothetical protein [Rhodospirillaceae bacterium]
MSVHRYAPHALAVDYGRGIVGLVLSGGLLALSPSLPLVVVFAGLTVLFLAFTVRTAWRHRARLELTSEGLILHPSSAGALLWRDIDGIRLRYYSTRRSRDKGWMTLRLKAGRRRVEVDSALEGFEEVMARAAGAVRAHNIRLDPATRANFQASGHLLDAEPAGEAAGQPFGFRRARPHPPDPGSGNGSP